MTRRIQPGHDYGLWHVLHFQGNRRGRPYYRCRCQCGTVKAVDGYDLWRGASTSCGCLRVKHGGAWSPTYTSWAGMLQTSRFGRQIALEPRWLQYAEFVADMGEREEHEVLTRIDRAQGFFIDNCEWVTRRELATRRWQRATGIAFEGEIRTVTGWARAYGMPRATLAYWINRFGVEKALSRAAQRRRVVSSPEATIAASLSR